MDKYMTLHEVHDITKISVYTLRQYIREEKLRATRRGNKYLVLEKDLQEFMLQGFNK